MAAVSEQSPSIRLPKRVHAIVAHQLKRMAEMEHVDKSTAQFCSAALIQFFKLSPQEQLQQIYEIERNLDAMESERDAEIAFGYKKTRPAKREQKP